MNILKITILGLLSLLISTNSEAKLLDINTNNIQDEIKSVQDFQYGETVYTIYQPGERLAFGKTSMAKIYAVQKLNEDEYLPRTIHVKTKSYYSLEVKDSKLPTILQSSINDLNVEKIIAPFDRFQNDNLSKHDRYGISRIYELTYNSDKNPYDVCMELMQNPDIEYAVPIFRRYINEYTPNDSELSKQWALNKIESFEAWDISKGDSSIVIAITDSGVDYLHPDLVDNIWYNPNEIPDDGIDNDNNGFIDDYRGWDFVGNISYSQALARQWKPDNDPKPGFWHGTHVAGSAAAVGDNGIGVAGPGYECKILAIKCGIDQANSRSIFRGYDAILYAAQMGAKIINCSWSGGGSSPVEQEIINTAFDMGSIVVVAAGNSRKNIDFGNSFPAGYDNVLCVGATRSNDRTAGFSNYGHKVTVYGPGQGIYATMPGNKYANQSGTSMSAPIVSGICGQLVDIHPDWSPKQIMHQIRSTSENVITTDPNLRPLYYGRVNAYRALTYNNSDLGNFEKIPGVSVSKFFSESVDILTDYETATFNIEIKNYLSSAKRLKVKIKPLNGYLSVSKDEEYIGTLNEMDSAVFSITVRLLESTPWFSGKVDILLTYESDSYVDYEILQIPLLLETKNQFSLRMIFPESALPQWYTGFCTDKDNYWLVGQRSNTGYGIVHRFGTNYNPVQITQFPLYALHAIDDNQLIAGSGGTVTQIAKTTNNGLNWTLLDVSNITKFINHIYFYDNSNGIFCGDPINNSWGVATSTNGGTTWSHATQVPTPLSGEASYVGAASGVGSNYWFGTNKGRVLSTKDGGKNWQAKTIHTNGFIREVCFIDSKSGIVIYTESQKSNQYKVASSRDGGYNWETDKFNFGDLGVTPIYLYSPDESKMIIALCSGGELYQTRDFGKNWTPILTYKFANISVGAAFGEGGECRMWNADSEISYLDFEYLPDNPKRIITVASGSSIDYGNVTAGKAKSVTLSVENTGNMKVSIDSLVIVYGDEIYDGEFKITFPLSSSINKGETATTKVKFLPKKEGTRNAEMTIYSNADGGNIKILLTGNGINGEKELKLSTDSIVSFDSVDISESSNKSIRFKNSGNIYFDITTFSIVPSEGYDKAEFFVDVETPFELGKNEYYSFSVTFTPTEAGLQEADLIITSEADDDLIVHLLGYGLEPVGVYEAINKEIVIEDILPNPVNDIANIILTVNQSKYIEINLYNNSGKLVKKLYSGTMPDGRSQIQLSTSDIPAGVYFIRLRSGNEFITKKLIVN